MSGGKIARIIILTVWVLIGIVATLIGAVIALPIYGFDLTTILQGLAFGLPVFWIGSAWCLCWVGFPIGWRLTAGLRDAFETGTVPWLVCLIVSVFVSLITFAFSPIISLFQIFFKWD